MTENRNLKIAADQNTSDQNTSDQNTSNQNTPGQKAPDPFDVEALRLPPSFVETAGVKKILSTVPVRKPHRQEWIRVHPSEAYRGNFATIHLEGRRRVLYFDTRGRRAKLRKKPSRSPFTR